MQIIFLNGFQLNNFSELCLQSIMSYNGSALVAMTGKDCVAIASDRRYGVQFQTIACDFDKTFQVGDKLFLGLSGLASDIQTV